MHTIIYYTLLLRVIVLYNTHAFFFRFNEKVVLSSPADYYVFDTRYIIVPETHTRIQITPVVKKINSDVKWRSLKVRKCYLQNERKLSIFQQYTEANCHNECSINETITTCECINIEAAC